MLLAIVGIFVIITIIISVRLINQKALQTGNNNVKKDMEDLLQNNYKLIEENNNYKETISDLREREYRLEAKNTALINGVEVDKLVDRKVADTVINYIDGINNKDFNKIRSSIYGDESMLNVSKVHLENGFKLKRIELVYEKIGLDGIPECNVYLTDENDGSLGVVLEKFNNDWRIVRLD